MGLWGKDSSASAPWILSLSMEMFGTAAFGMVVSQPPPVHVQSTVQRAIVPLTEAEPSLVFPGILVADGAPFALTMPTFALPTLDTAALKAGEDTFKGVAPVLQKDLETTLQVTQTKLKEAEPELKKAAEELTPVIKSGAESALTQLAPVLKRGVDTASGEANGLLSKYAPVVERELSQAQSGLSEALTKAASKAGEEASKAGLEASKAGLEASSKLPKELTQDLPNAAGPILEQIGRDVAPKIKGGLETGLREAKPILKRTADELGPKLAGAGSSAVTTLTPVVQSGASSLADAISKAAQDAIGPYADDALFVGALVVVPVVVFKVAEVPHAQRHERSHPLRSYHARSQYTCTCTCAHSTAHPFIPHKPRTLTPTLAPNRSTPNSLARLPACHAM